MTRTTPLPPERIEQIGLLLDEASPTPWKLSQYDQLYIRDADGRIVIDIRYCRRGNVNLLLAAPTALSELLDEVERLRLRNAALQNLVDAYYAGRTPTATLPCCPNCNGAMNSDNTEFIPDDVGSGGVFRHKCMDRPPG